MASLKDASSACTSSLDSRSQRQLKRTQMEAIRALAATAEAKDPYMRAHSRTVAKYAEAIGRRMGLNSNCIGRLRTAALLHDIGKIAVPDAILNKPGPLTPDEFRIIERHPETAIDILRHVSFLADERPAILHHHERYDGSGYPSGLARDRIPLDARVLAIADSMDTMLSSRSYKPAYDLNRVRRELLIGAGHQFDPDIAELAIGWLGDARGSADTQSENAPVYAGVA